MVRAWLSMSVFGFIVVLCSLLPSLIACIIVFWLQIAIEPFALFHHSGLIICVSLWCFTNEVEDPYADRIYIFNLKLHQHSGRGFARVKLVKPLNRFPTDRSKAVPLLQFFVCASVVSYHSVLFSLFVPHLSFLWCLGKAVLRDCGFSWVSSLIIFNW